ncbi:hypothetical protein KBD75_04535 [Candidatus Woesebacteria bacterium]|nr:hypothetical protein [Candidatus Woesebacteria bacterium]
MSVKELIVGFVAQGVPFDTFMSARNLVAKKSERTTILEIARDSNVNLHRNRGIDFKYFLATMLASMTDVHDYADVRHGIVLRELAKVDDGLQADPENTFMSVEGLAQRQDALIAEKNIITVAKGHKPVKK